MKPHMPASKVCHELKSILQFQDFARQAKASKTAQEIITERESAPALHPRLQRHAAELAQEAVAEAKVGLGRDQPELSEEEEQKLIERKKEELLQEIEERVATAHRIREEMAMRKAEDEREAKKLKGRFQVGDMVE
jgi:hypothetical protein